MIEPAVVAVVVGVASAAAAVYSTLREHQRALQDAEDAKHNAKAAAINASVDALQAMIEEERGQAQALYGDVLRARHGDAMAHALAEDDVERFGPKQRPVRLQGERVAKALEIEKVEGDWRYVRRGDWVTVSQRHDGQWREVWAYQAHEKTGWT